MGFQKDIKTQNILKTFFICNIPTCIYINIKMLHILLISLGKIVFFKPNVKGCDLDSCAASV